MLEAAAWGLFGASSLLLGAVIGLALPIRRGRSKRDKLAKERTNGLIGVVLAFGAGTLISAVAFELTDEAYKLGGADIVAIGLALGALAYFAGNVAIARRGGRHRMKAHSRDDADSASALLLGAILDGIPESAVIGISLLGGGTVGAPILAAVFISNMPESISSSYGMREQGIGARHIIVTWVLVCMISAAAAAAGYGLLESASDDMVGLIQAFAGGAVLTMLADTMIPDALNNQPQDSALARSGVGLFTVLGFALAYLLSTLE